MEYFPVESSALAAAYESLPKPRPRLASERLVFEMVDGVEVTHLYSTEWQVTGCNRAKPPSSGRLAKGSPTRPGVWCRDCVWNNDTFFPDFADGMKFLSAVSVLNGPGHTAKSLAAAVEVRKSLISKKYLHLDKEVVDGVLRSALVLQAAHGKDADPLFKARLVGDLITWYPAMVLEATPSSIAFIETATSPETSISIRGALAQAFQASLASGESAAARSVRIREAVESALPEAPTTISQLNTLPSSALVPTHPTAVGTISEAWCTHVDDLLTVALDGWESTIEALPGPSTHLVATSAIGSYSSRIEKRDLEARMFACWPNRQKDSTVLLHVPERVAYLRDSRNVKTIPCEDIPERDVLEEAFSLWERGQGSFARLTDAYEATLLTMR